jgi:hypothetical protein
VPHDACKTVVNTFLDAIDTDPLTLRDDGVGMLEEAEKQAALATLQSFGEKLHAKYGLPAT